MTIIAFETGKIADLEDPLAQLKRAWSSTSIANRSASREMLPLATESAFPSAEAIFSTIDQEGIQRVSGSGGFIIGIDRSSRDAEDQTASFLVEDGRIDLRFAPAIFKGNDQ